MENLLLITGIALSLAGLLYAVPIGLFTFGWYRQKGTPGTRADGNGMKVSVVVAARNEENCIADLLADLAAQLYPSSLTEIIVIDDHSTDKTYRIVEDSITKLKHPGLKLLKNEGRPGKKAAIELGIGHSTGDLIFSTDADCRIGPGWIASMECYFHDTGKVMISGPVSYLPGKGLTGRFQSLEFSGLVASGAGAALAGRPFLCNGANLAYRKNAFMQVKGYAGNEQFISGDDVFLLHKMKMEFGGKAIGFALDKDALVRTCPAKGIVGFFNQRIRWASKTRGYRDKISILTAAAVFSFSFFLAFTFLAGFCHPLIFLLYTGALLLKSAIDLPLMWGVTGFTGNRKLMKWYLLFQVIYPFYVVIAGVLSLVPRKSW